ncbi:MAG: hypothetical protein JWO00_46 [Candidatus Parcubacteria bacterium]|nr:hypothetical protein [Candidatus Parcubacteria bacterium]
MNDQYKKGKDLTKEAPVSPKLTLGGFVIMARTIDKCRATLWGNVGEYHFDCPVDNMLFSFKGITGDAFKAFVAEGHSNMEIAEWVKANGIPKTDEEIAAWNKDRLAYNMSDGAKKGWLEGENVRLGLDKDAPLFDMLIADDKASVGGGPNVCM